MNKGGVYLKAFIAFIIWSFVGVILNKSSFTAFQNIFLSSLLSFLWFLLIIIWKNELNSIKKIKLNSLLMALVVVSGIAGVMWLSSLTLMPVAQALFLFNIIPVFALLIELFVLKQKVKPIHIVAIGTGLLGIFILVSNGLIISRGNFLSFTSLLVLGAAFLYAVQGNIIKKLGSSYSFEIMMLAIMGAQAIVGWLLVFRSTWHFDSFSLAGTILLSIFSWVFAYYFYIGALKGLKVSTVRLIGYVEPLLGSIWGVVFLSQALVPVTVFGGFFILLASYMAIRSGE